jgi:hypothetical protein
VFTSGVSVFANIRSLAAPSAAAHKPEYFNNSRCYLEMNMVSDTVAMLDSYDKRSAVFVI